jgi:amino acid transporter
MVGIIIGSGIFRTPPRIAGELGSPALILLLWVVGGVLSLFGALAYAELGTMFPRSGGIYVYLHHGLGGPVAFIFGWTYMLIAKPFAAAGIGMVFAEHVLKLCGAEAVAGGVDWRAQTLCAVMLVAVTALNVAGTRLGAGVAVVLTGLKVAALAMIVGLGLLLAKEPAGGFASVEAPKPFLAALAPVMLSILWTYDGWSDVASVAGEVKEPRRLLPRILLAGTAATVVLYVAVNAVYFSLVPLPEMRGVPTVAPLVMERLLGPAGATVVTVMIVVSTLGATHGSIITGARVTFAQARDGLLFRFLGRVHPRFETPAVSLWVQAALSCAAVAYLGRFEDLSENFAFTMWIFYGMAVAAVVVLRERKPDLDRPYRCWGYPFVPALFVLAALAVTALSVRADPGNKLPWLGLLVAGLPVYYLWKRMASPTR